MTDKYKDALHQAQEELAALEERRATLLRLIQNLKELSDDDKYELEPPPGYVPKGLTEEIRTILSLTTLPLDAVGIRDALIQRGFRYSSPKNLLIGVHTVLGRIKDELDVIEQEAGKPTYKAKQRGMTLGDLANPNLDLEKMVDVYKAEQERMAKMIAEMTNQHAGALSALSGPKQPAEDVKKKK